MAQILVVDDFLPWQRFVFRLFEPHMDLRIMAVANDGFQAVQKAKELQPDLILMDLSLPGLNGIEATREILTISPASKILFVSEHRGSDVIQAALEAGASGYVLKSDSHSDLIRGVRAVLAGEQFVSSSLRNWRETYDADD